MNIQTLKEQFNDNDVLYTDDLGLDVYEAEIYIHNDWQSLNVFTLYKNESILTETIKELKEFNQYLPLKVRIFDRDYVELIYQHGEVVIEDMSGGCGCDDYIFDGHSLQPTEFNF
jgi:hypothetical protein